MSTERQSQKTETTVSETDVLFLAISGMRGTGRTKLFKQLEHLLPGVFGDQTFAFFEDEKLFGKLPHPLLWAEKERKSGPVGRLFHLWGMLEDFNTNDLLPALNSCDIVIVDGYGLNALLYATAYAEGCREEDQAASLMHHHIVRGRVIAQNIPPPEYFITLAECEAQTRYLRNTIPQLSMGECREFILKEERIIRDYFKPETGQRGVFLDAAWSINDMAEVVIDTINQHLDQKRQAAA